MTTFSRLFFISSLVFPLCLLPMDDVAQLQKQLSNLPSSGAMTPLHIAASRGNTEAVAMFLKLGAEVDAIDTNGKTPLMEASHAGKALVIPALLAAGAKVDRSDLIFHYQPLHWACKWGSDDVIEPLVLAGADPHAADKAGKSALQIAFDAGHSSRITALLSAYEKRKAMLEQKKNNFPLHLACNGDSPEEVEKLILADAALDTLDAHGLSPMHYLGKNTNPLIAKAFVDAIAKKAELKKNGNSVVGDSTSIASLPSASLPDTKQP